MKLLPNRHYDSVSDIPWNSLEASHFIFDLDNTLLPWGLSDFPSENLGLLHQLRQENKTIAILSNSKLIGRHERLLDQLDGLDIAIIPDARKPSSSGFRKLLGRWNVTPSDCAMVGDQWITDVIGANRLGMMSILVAPIDPHLEPWWARWRRYVERWLLVIFMKKNGTA